MSASCFNYRMRSTLTAVTMAVATCFVLAPTPALAQQPKPDAKKPADKPADKKKPEEPKPEEKKPEEPKPEEKKAEEPKTTDAASSVSPPAETWDIKDVEELPGK